MKSIDIKSLLIGILGTALVMVLMGLSKVGENRWQTSCSDRFCVLFDTKEGQFHGVVSQSKMRLRQDKDVIPIKYRSLFFKN